MRAGLFFKGADVRRQVTRIWLLLVVSAIITGAGNGRGRIFRTAALRYRRHVARVRPKSSGVAIAISLVPPLTVVGLTLESAEPGQALGALLLFLANVSAILMTGNVTIAVYERLRSGRSTIGVKSRWPRNGVIAVVAMVVVVAVPLATTSAKLAATSFDQSTISAAMDQ